VGGSVPYQPCAAVFVGSVACTLRRAAAGGMREVVVEVPVGARGRSEVSSSRELRMPCAV
jgi:hypothetical protein